MTMHISFAAVWTPLRLAATALAISAAPAKALDVRYGPDARALAYPVSGGGTPSGIETIILHNIGVFSDTNETIALTKVRIDVIAAGKIEQSQTIGDKALSQHAAVWARRQALGRLRTDEPIFQVSKIINGSSLADSLQLEHGSGILISRTPLLISATGDAVNITAEGVGVDGSPRSKSLSVPIVRYISSNSYIFPLRGRWLIAVGPNLNGHHRWGAAQEFALDIGKFGPEMHSHRGDGSRPEMFYGFGAPVFAVASGEVVAAVDEFSDADNLRRPGESEDKFQARLTGQQGALMAAGFRKVIGNHVVIRHAAGEYSLYAHLQANSVRVRQGQQVSVGEPIAALGHSGNSTEPHLHFSIQDGPDPIYSRSLPVRFANVKFWDQADGGSGIINSGNVVETSK